MIRLITSIEFKSAIKPDSEFKKIKLLHPFGKLKITTAADDDGTLKTINLSATIARNEKTLCEPSIVRVCWAGGSIAFGSQYLPVLPSITDDDSVALSIKYQTADDL